LVVATDEGDILLCNYNGEYKEYIISSPKGEEIRSITAFGRGIIVGGTKG
jgi:hypothetical protein